MEKEARDKFDEEGGEASQSYTILLVKSKKTVAVGFHKAIVKMAERASNVAKDWTKGWERTRRRQGKRHLGET